VTGVYVIRPRADRDIDEYAQYLLEQASLETAKRFLDSARNMFELLASHPNMGWPARLKHPHLRELRVFRVSGFERMLILYLPLHRGVEILRMVHGSRNVHSLFRRREELE